MAGDTVSTEVTADAATEVTADAALAPPPTDPLVKERVRRVVRERLFAIAAPPVTIGRFVVLDRIGAGGMATVYAAYDPQLERKVALKVFHDADAGANDPRSQRLVREAKVMARVAHPNVATVFDAGVLDGRVVIAMEYAPAGTLRDWLAAAPRGPTEIVDAFVQAARGLAAAHAAGIVHRDFKPENVLVADGGRVLVTDFGIAGDAAGPATDGVAGTLRYMAPEQLRGAALDARTDQFSWCVCVFEALCGAHPFVGESAVELAQSILEGARRAAVPAPRRAAALLPVLNRGLAGEVDRRYPTLAELVAAIAQRRRRRRMGFALAGVVLAAAGGSAAWIAARGPAAPAPCGEVASELAGVWDVPRANALATAFTATGAPYAAATFTSVHRNLDAHANAWLAMRTEACEATHVRHVESERWLADRYRCLDARRRELDALIGVLATPEAAVVERAHDAVAKLTPVAVCAESSGQWAAEPADGAVAALDRRVDDAEAQLRAGRYRAGLEIAEQVVTEAGPLAHDPLLARALHVRGLLHGQLGAAADAVASLYEAGRVAARGRADWRAAEVAIELVYQVVYVQSQNAQLDPLRHAAEAAVERVGNPPRLAALLYRALGTAARQSGQLEAALAHHRAALAAIERLGPGNEPELATTYGNLANVHRDRGEYAAASELYERALELHRRQHGPDHPLVAHALNNMALVFEQRGELAEATQRYEAARGIFEHGLGTEHPHVAMTLNNLANTLRKQGRVADAVPLAERSIAIFAKARGEDHPHVAWPLNTLGQLLAAQGAFDQAHAAFQRARAIRVARLGVDHPLVAMIDTSIGTAYLLADRANAAVAPLEHALAVRRTTKAAPAAIAESAFPLARALWQTGRRAQGLDLAREAKQLLATSELAATPEQAEVDRWLAAHDR